MRRISRGEVVEIRTRLLAKQSNKCAICGCSLRGKVRGGAVLDHDHETGIIRGVLCRSCNGGEGKIKSAAIRYFGGSTRWLQNLRSMLGYLSFHTTAQTPYIHPTHLSDEEKRLKRNKKARLKRARSK